MLILLLHDRAAKYLNGAVRVPGGDKTQVGAVPKGSDLRPRSVGDSAQQGTAVSLLGPVGGEHEAKGEREGVGGYLGGGRIIMWERERLGSLFIPHSCETLLCVCSVERRIFGGEKGSSDGSPTMVQGSNGITCSLRKAQVTFGFSLVTKILQSRAAVTALGIFLVNRPRWIGQTEATMSATARTHRRLALRPLRSLLLLLHTHATAVVDSVALKAMRASSPRSIPFTFESSWIEMERSPDASPDAEIRRVCSSTKMRAPTLPSCAFPMHSWYL